MEKAINKALSDRFSQLLETNDLRDPVSDALICTLQKELRNSLSDSQLSIFKELDSLLTTSETYKMEQSFRIGFLEGLKVGRAILS